MRRQTFEVAVVSARGVQVSDLKELLTEIGLTNSPFDEIASIQVIELEDRRVGEG